MKKRRVAMLMSSLLILAVVISGCTQSPSVKTKGKEAKQVKLQDDFYDHINEKLIREKRGEDHTQSWDQFQTLSNSLKENLNHIITKVSENQDQYEAGSTERTIADLYETAINKKVREETGLGSLKQYVDAIKASDSITAYLETTAKIYRELGKAGLLAFELTPDPKDSSKYSLFLEEPVQLAKKEHMESEEMQEELKNYLASLLQAEGMKSSEVSQWSDKLFDFYNKLSDTALSQKDKNNVENVMNYFTQEQLQAKLSNMNVHTFLKESGQSENLNLIVVNPAMLPVINSYLTMENLELLKQYAIVTLLHEYAPYLNRSFSQAHAKFNQSETNEEELAWNAFQDLGEAELGELYAKEYFSPEKKEAVQKLVKDILAAYKKNLAKVSWLSEESRSKAIKKIDTMGVKIGYPETYTSHLKGRVVSSKEGGSFIDNALIKDKQKADYERRKAQNAVNHEEWGLSPITLNAYYEPSSNEIVFPAAMLQAPFYDEKSSYAANLGGIGAVIAHEITHAFDDMGALYDENGNYGNWWNEKDRQGFKEQSEKVVKYFGSYEVMPGLKIDGELTLGENIADMGSISVLSSMLEKDTGALKEMYKSYANIWAAAVTEEELKDQLQNDNHSPAKARVNAVLSTTDAFYDVFGIQKGDGMYVPPQRRVKMY